MLHVITQASIFFDHREIDLSPAIFEAAAYTHKDCMQVLLKHADELSNMDHVRVVKSLCWSEDQDDINIRRSKQQILRMLLEESRL